MAERRREGILGPVDMARDALRNFQNGPDIPRPTLLQAQIPGVGPVWEAAADLQDGDYAGAAFNGLVALASVTPAGATLRGVNAARQGVTILKKGSTTAKASASRLRAWGVAGKGEEIHHTVPLNGIKRNEPNWRNHYALLKVMPKEQHRRLTGKWDGKPRYDPIRGLWYGTTDWQKAVPVGAAGYGADTTENVSRRAAAERKAPTDRR